VVRPPPLSTHVFRQPRPHVSNYGNIKLGRIKTSKYLQCNNGKLFNLYKKRFIQEFHNSESLHSSLMKLQETIKSLNILFYQTDLLLLLLSRCFQSTPTWTNQDPDICYSFPLSRTSPELHHHGNIDKDEIDNIMETIG